MSCTNLNLVWCRGISYRIVVELHDYIPERDDFVELTVQKTPNSPVEFSKKAYFEKVDEASPTYNAYIEVASGDTDSMERGEYIYDIRLAYSNFVRDLVPRHILTVK